MNPFERVQKLIALATNAGASIDEQRNAAHAAVKLLVEHKMLDQRAIPPPPPMGPFGGLGAIFAGLTVETILSNAAVMAAGAASIETLELHNKNAVLERQVARLKQEITRLNGELVGRADAPMPHREKRRRRR